MMLFALLLLGIYSQRPDPSLDDSDDSVFFTAFPSDAPSEMPTVQCQYLIITDPQNDEFLVELELQENYINHKTWWSNDMGFSVYYSNETTRWVVASAHADYPTVLSAEQTASNFPPDGFYNSRDLDQTGSTVVVERYFECEGDAIITDEPTYSADVCAPDMCVTDDERSSQHEQNLDDLTEVARILQEAREMMQQITQNLQAVETKKHDFQQCYRNFLDGMYYKPRVTPAPTLRSASPTFLMTLEPTVMETARPTGPVTPEPTPIPTLAPTFAPTNVVTSRPTPTVPLVTAEPTTPEPTISFYEEVPDLHGQICRGAGNTGGPRTFKVDYTSVEDCAHVCWNNSECQWFNVREDWNICMGCSVPPSRGYANFLTYRMVGKDEPQRRSLGKVQIAEDAELSALQLENQRLKNLLGF